MWNNCCIQVTAVPFKKERFSISLCHSHMAYLHLCIMVCNLINHLFWKNKPLPEKKIFAQLFFCENQFSLITPIRSPVGVYPGVSFSVLCPLSFRCPTLMYHIWVHKKKSKSSLLCRMIATRQSLSIQSTIEVDCHNFFFFQKNDFFILEVKDL